MSSLHQYEGWTVEEVVARNSHELTALHLLGARQFIVDQRAERARELAATRALMSEMHRIGLAVLRAKRAGRKTVRIDELTATIDGVAEVAS